MTRQMRPLVLSRRVSRSEYCMCPFTGLYQSQMYRSPRGPNFTSTGMKLRLVEKIMSPTYFSSKWSPFRAHSWISIRLVGL